jgi:NADPH:quinone reductase-like Zn-dependent oxidoreductase
MHAAIVDGAGQPPRFGEFPEPITSRNQTLINITASALSPLARNRASGTHYSSGNSYPFIPGVDGVGQLDDGRRVYFLLPEAPFGAMAERTIVDDSRWFEIPKGLDDVRAALIANPGMSSWAALTERACIRVGDTVLVNGATGASGQLAVRIARHLGATKVIATGRNIAVLEALGADATIALGDDPDQLEGAFAKHFASGIDIVLDYLWGQSARSILVAGAKAGPDGIPIRFVQIGAISGAEIPLPAAVLRSSSIVMMGSGLGSVGLDRLTAAIHDLFQVAVPIGLQLDCETIDLSDIGAAWKRPESKGRIVFTVG